MTARFVFWWVLLLLIQQAQRLLLTALALAHEPTSARTLTQTLVTGVRADLITAGLGMIAVLAVSLVAGSLVLAVRRAAGRALHPLRTYGRALTITALVATAAFFVVLTIDMGYYRYSGQRLDFVFFEYVGDVLDQATSGTAAAETQVGRQTAAEAGEVSKWIAPLAGYLALEIGFIAAWVAVFRRWLRPALAAAQSAAPRVTVVALAVIVAAGAWGLHPSGPETVQAAAVSQSTYYALAQNPLWYSGAALQDRLTMHALVPPAILAVMPEARAARLTQALVAPGATFPEPRYPLVHAAPPGGHALARRPNVLLLFVEALDRRHLGRTVAGVRVTPFLDRLFEDSVTFGGFHSNGAQTFHGLFATLCSALPRHGVAATKARYGNDYLCLPSLLKRAGYRTQMVIGQNRDRNHSRLGLFMARNGLDELIDEGAFPPGAPRMGLGLTDSALFDRLVEQIRELRATGRPWFLTALTTSTHHPFAVPDAHPDITALRAQSDRYLPALRYTDFALEQFFATLQRDGLLRDTVVLILGDHGRHESIDAGQLAQHAAGHFLSPLAIWLDPSLRGGPAYRPRVVPGLASQVDLTPTILALAGLSPRVSPFAGLDLSCALASDCLPERTIFVSDVYDNFVGVVDRDGFWFYSLNYPGVEHTDLKLKGVTPRTPPGDPSVAARVEQILAAYVTSNTLIESNRLWSWKEFGGRL
ncbi:MAG TPA: LTA synthase family protein [Candidatus Binatia bacterium]|nr:LTA synthase family protein [Candidatus Binatia bacterium]